MDAALSVYKRRWLLIVLLVASSLSCGPIKQPKPSDLIGVYKIDSKSRETLTKKGYKNIPPIVVMIEHNGTIRLENIPDCVFGSFGESHGKFLSHTARWKCCDEATFFTLWDGLPLWIEMEDGSMFGTLILKGRNSPYSLNFLIGDPDNGEAVVLEREPHRV